MLSEDLVRGPAKVRPENLTMPPDGQTLEGIIGELQSVWGVPQYPQEWRITIKVAEPRGERQSDGRGERQPEARSDRKPSPPAVTAAREGGESGPPNAPATSGASADGPKRERAPAAPRLGNSGGGGQTAEREGPPKSRRRGRRGRRRRPSDGGANPEAGRPAVQGEAGEMRDGGSSPAGGDAGPEPGA